MPKPRKGYISLTLPPEYLMALFPAVETPSLQTYSNVEISIILTLNQVKHDLPRTPWNFGENSKPLFCGLESEGAESTLRDMRNSFKVRHIKPMPDNADTRLEEQTLYIKLIENGALAYSALNSQGRVVSIQIPPPELQTQFGKNYFAFQTALEEFKTQGMSQDGASPLTSFLPELLEITAQKNQSHLTRDEAAALCTFACVDGKNEALQGGFFRFAEPAIGFWLNQGELGLQGQLSGSKARLQATRNKENALEVLSEINFFKWHSSVPTKSSLDSTLPLIMYSSQCEIRQKGKNFTLTRLNNPENCNVLFEENFFNQYIFKPALEKLGRTNFGESDLKLFTPLLSHYSFAQTFFKKLKGSVIQPQTVQFLLHYIPLCFDTIKKHTFWEHHQNKIIATASSIILAALFTAAVMTFGVSLILTAAGGGVLLLGTIANMLASANVDNMHQRRLLFNSLEKIKTLNEKNKQSIEASTTKENNALGNNVPILPNNSPESLRREDDIHSGPVLTSIPPAGKEGELDQEPNQMKELKKS